MRAIKNSRRRIYGETVRDLQETAKNVARKCFPDLYADGFLDQELETIFEDCERIVAEIIFYDDGTIREDAEDLLLLYDPANDIIDAVITGGQNVRDFIERVQRGGVQE